MGIDFVYSCGCYEKTITRPTIDYLDDKGKIRKEISKVFTPFRLMRLTHHQSDPTPIATSASAAVTSSGPASTPASTTAGT